MQRDAILSQKAPNDAAEVRDLHVQVRMEDTEALGAAVAGLDGRAEFAVRDDCVRRLGKQMKQ